MIKTTQSRVVNKWGMMVGDTVLLENGNEKYYVIFKQMAKRIAKNMKFAKWIEGGWKSFYNYVSINFDRATASDPSTIRDILLFFIKHYLNISNDSIYYVNPHGICFKFTSFFIIVSQEIQHIFIRARKIKIWKFHHSDSSSIRLNWLTVVKGCTKKYDPKETPPILIDEIESKIYDRQPQYHPFNLVRNKLKLFQNRKLFDEMCEIVKNIWKLRSTFAKTLQDELKQRIYHNDLIKWKQVNECLMNIVKWSPSRYLTAVLSIFMIGWDRWNNPPFKEDRWYKSLHHKVSGELTQSDIPYCIAGEAEYEDILNILHLKTEDYPNEFAPFASVLQLTAAFDSIFWYVCIYSLCFGFIIKIYHSIFFHLF